MGIADSAKPLGALASPQGSLSKDILHRDSMSVTATHGVVKLPGQGSYAFNYQPQLAVTGRGTWLCVWTQASIEADRDQRVVLARSDDAGSTWSAEIVIEQASGAYHVPAWIMIYTVPHTGRIYVFYWYNLNAVPLRDAGDIFYKFSDDDGYGWSERFSMHIPRKAIDDADGDIHGWNFGQPRLLPTGQVIFTFNKMRRSAMFPPGWHLDVDNQWIRPGDAASDAPEPIQGGDPNQWETEVWFAECVNILTESDPAKLRFTILPEGDHGLWVPYPDSERHFGQEGTVVGLSGNRLLCVFRSRRGHPYFSVSADLGKTWSPPEVLRYCPDGEPLSQPCAPCPIHKTSDGGFVLIFHNVVPNERGWHPRDPMWVTVAREAPGVRENAGLFFAAPKVILYNDRVPGGPFKDTEISYPQFYEIANQHYIVYANKTSEIRINKIAPELLDDYGLPR
jgi:hypothetical protein